MKLTITFEIKTQEGNQKEVERVFQEIMNQIEEHARVNPKEAMVVETFTIKN